MNRPLPHTPAQSSNRSQAARRITWTSQADARLTHLHASGASIRALARAFGLGRQAVSERAMRLGIITKQPLVERKPPLIQNDDATRDPLPAGHFISWGLLIAGTSLEGAPYQVSSNGNHQALDGTP